MAEEVAELISDYNQNISRANDPIEQSIEMSQTERSIAQKCAPLVEQGKEVCKQVIQLQEEYDNEFSLIDQELYEIVNMSDDQLALLALQINVLSEYEEIIAYENERQISSNVYVDCALQAIGATDIIHLIGGVLGDAAGGASVGLIIKGTKTIINAKTMSKLLYGFAIRYVGWLGVGITLYDYITCVKSHNG